MTHLSAALLGAALVFTPAFSAAQQAPLPETAIPRHPKHEGGHGGFAPPADRRMPPDPHHDIPAHPNETKPPAKAKKAKNGSGGAGGASNGAASGAAAPR